MASAIKERRLVLISGYSGAGKNTLAKSLQGQNAIHWRFLTSYSDNGRTFIPGPIWETSFAKCLKTTVSERLGIPLDDVELLKDVPLSAEQRKIQASLWNIAHNAAIPMPTLRDVLKDEAAFKRGQHEDFYAEAAHDDILAIGKFAASAMITDWRYPNEYRYFKRVYGEHVLSIRVIRNPYIASSSPSEHALDDFSPDIVAIPAEVQDEVVYFNGEAYAHPVTLECSE
jgi:hypothetical protein